MTIQEYNDLHDKIQGSSNYADSTGERTFRWELLKAIWELTRVIKGELGE